MTTQAKVIVKLKHDKGTVKISTWATSLQDAITKVCTAENCPETAVIYAKVSPLTISDIKYLSEATSPHFFTRSALRFFKQTIGSFSVTRWGNDKFYICAPFGAGMGGGKTERIFNPFTNELERLPS